MDWMFQLHMSFVVWSLFTTIFCWRPKLWRFFFQATKKTNSKSSKLWIWYDWWVRKKLFRREELKGKKWTLSWQWFGKWFATSHVWVVVSNISYFHPYYWERFLIWLIFFRGGWNHQLVMLFLTICWLKESFFYALWPSPYQLLVEL